MNPAVHSLPAARLLTWAAWSPNRTDGEAWRQWARGEVSPDHTDTVAIAAPCLDVPALLRRRCSTLTRMMLEAAFAACRQSGQSPKDVTMVYCSRHGEMGVLRQLLDNLSERQPMSPAHFSNSVHHSATGYFDMAAGNRLASKTLSGGEANLVCGFLEALGMLRQWPSRACLLMFADERLPEPFRIDPDQPPFPYAIGFMLGSGSVGAGTTLKLRQELGESGSPLWSAGAKPVPQGGTGGDPPSSRQLGDYGVAGPPSSRRLRDCGAAGTALDLPPPADSTQALKSQPTAPALFPSPSRPGSPSRGAGRDAVLDFLRWLECDEPTFSLPTQFGTWTWKK